MGRRLYRHRLEIRGEGCLSQKRQEKREGSTSLYSVPDCGVHRVERREGRTPLEDIRARRKGIRVKKKAESGLGQPRSIVAVRGGGRELTIENSVNMGLSEGGLG